MLVDRIKKVLKRRPYWGAETIAKHLGTSAKVVRVVASKHEIKLMTRYEVEAYMDPLVDAVESIRGTEQSEKEAPLNGESATSTHPPEQP